MAEFTHLAVRPSVFMARVAARSFAGPYTSLSLQHHQEQNAYTTLIVN